MSTSRLHPLETMNVMAGHLIVVDKVQSAIMAKNTGPAVNSSLYIVFGGYSKTNLAKSQTNYHVTVSKLDFIHFHHYIKDKTGNISSTH